MPPRPVPDRFRILEELQHGEGEILLRAYDEKLGREVVLRRPKPGLEQVWRDRNVADAEMRSARALACVQHPNVVRLNDVFDTDDGPLISMVPVPGETLHERLARDGKLEPDEVARIGAAIAGALEAVHAQNVVHRGISTTSIVLRPDGTPCLTGFIFAKFDARAGTSVPGTTFFFTGKDVASAHALPPHPAPEQVRGENADARSDLFGLGWVLYEALTGESPYPRDLEPDRWDAPTDPRKLVPATPKPLAQAIVKCLAVSPLKRFASAAELRAALEAVATKPVGGGVRPARRVLVGATSFVLLGALAAVWFTHESKTANAEMRGPDSPESPRSIARGELSDEYAHSHALLIGIGKGYSKNGFSDLPNAEHDVDSIEKKLRGMEEWEHWQIRRIPGSEATAERIRNEVRDLATRVGEEDRVLVYYAGHGMPDELSDNWGYIIPIDGKTAASDRNHISWINFQDAFGLLFDMNKPAKHVLVALDCCFGGRMNAKRGMAVAPCNQYSSACLTRRAHIVITSGQKDQTVRDSDGGDHSPFAQAFLDALSRDQDQVMSSGLFNEVTHAVTRFPGQLPTCDPRLSDQGGQFVFFTKRRD